MRFFWVFLLMTYFGKAQPSSLLAYERADNIYVIDDNTNAVLVTLKGADPHLSPDGTKLAYTSRSTGDRKAVVYSLTTKKHLSINVGNHTSYAPVWSPDGQHLAFKTFVSGRWSTGIFSFVDKTFRILTNAHECNAPTWTADSKRLIVHDMNKVYIYELNGRLAKSYSFGTITKDYSISSDSRFILMPDEQTFLFTADVYKVGTFPIGGVFMHNLQTGALIQLTPKGLNCTADLFLSNQNEVFFSGSYDHEASNNIHKINLSTRKFKTVVKDARFPSTTTISLPDATIPAESTDRYARYMGTYEYIENYPFNKKGIKENHYIVIWKDNGRLTGLYFGTSADFEEATEEVPDDHPQIPGFFVTEMKDLAVIDNRLSFSLSISEADLFTKPINLKIGSTQEAKDAGYKNWNYQIEEHTKKYTGQLQPGETLELRDETRTIRRTFKKLDY